MKGIFSFPFKTGISLIIAFFILFLGILELNSFYSFQNKNEIINAATELKNAMQSLKNVGDIGSTLRREIQFSKGTIIFNNETENIVASINEWNKTFETDLDILNRLEIDAGIKQIELHWGSGQERELTVFFY